MNVRRILLTAAAVWIVLTVLGVGTHLMIWSDVGGAHPAHMQFDGPLLKPVANLMQLLVTPGWLVIRSLPGNAMRANVLLIGAIYGLSWGAWILAGLVASWMRHLLTHRRYERAEAPDRMDRPVNMARRRLLVDGALAGAAMLTGGSAAKASLIDPWALTLRSYRIPIRDLPVSLDGMRIVQISDTHLGPRIPATFIEEVVRQSLALRPDLFVLTGDYIHYSSALAGQAGELLAPLARSGNLGVVGVLGNHDHYAGGGAVRDALRSAGIRMIDNHRVFIDGAAHRLADVAPEQEGLCVAGLGDLLTSRVDVHRALGGVPDDMPRLVLAHVPDTAEIDSVVRGPRIDLMLCGHTHGGQVRVPLMGTPVIPSDYGQKYAGGLVQGPACRVLVHRGVGMSILPVRFGVPPELVEITLVSA